MVEMRFECAVCHQRKPESELHIVCGPCAGKAPCQCRPGLHTMVVCAVCHTGHQYSRCCYDVCGECLADATAVVA